MARTTCFFALLLVLATVPSAAEASADCPSAEPLTIGKSRWIPSSPSRQLFSFRARQGQVLNIQGASEEGGEFSYGFDQPRGAEFGKPLPRDGVYCIEVRHHDLENGDGMKLSVFDERPFRFTAALNLAYGITEDSDPGAQLAASLTLGVGTGVPDFILSMHWGSNEVSADDSDTGQAMGRQQFAGLLGVGFRAGGVPFRTREWIRIAAGPTAATFKVRGRSEREVGYGGGARLEGMIGAHHFLDDDFPGGPSLSVEVHHYPKQAFTHLNLGVGWAF